MLQTLPLLVTVPTALTLFLLHTPCLPPASASIQRTRDPDVPELQGWGWVGQTSILRLLQTLSPPSGSEQEGSVRKRLWIFLSLVFGLVLVPGLLLVLRQVRRVRREMGVWERERGCAGEEVWVFRCDRRERRRERERREGEEMGRRGMTGVTEQEIRSLASDHSLLLTPSADPSIPPHPPQTSSSPPPSSPPAPPPVPAPPPPRGKSGIKSIHLIPRTTQLDHLLAQREEVLGELERAVVRYVRSFRAGLGRAGRDGQGAGKGVGFGNKGWAFWVSAPYLSPDEV